MFNSFLWDFFSRFSNQIISFVVSIFLTRLLSPEEFGIMGIAWVMISVTTIFVDLGLGRAVIQQKDISNRQLSTVFFLNLIISIFFVVISFFLAHPMAVFFRQPRVEPVIQVISLSFIFYGLNIVPNALLYRKMKFKITSIISTVSALLSGIAGIYLAAHDYGVWSLVAQTLIAGILAFFFTFLYLRWLPQLVFILSEVKAMWIYSSRLFASALVDTVFARVDIFLIGRMYSPATLGYYTRAQSLDGVVRQTSSESIISVLFPYLSREQDNIPATRKLYIRYLHLISLAAFFLSGFLYLTAGPIFTILFTAKWNEAALLFKILTIAGFAYPVSSLMVNILIARGNSKAMLKLEILKRLLFIPVYVLGFFIGLHGFVYCLTGVMVLSVFLNALYVEKEIQIPFLNQLKIIAVYAIITFAIVLFIAVIPTLTAIENDWATLFLNGGMFTVLFTLIHFIVKTTGYSLALEKAKWIFAK
ncbi:MAG: lipopolysaccharide biosynthesis protein [Bacteroidota bacterium]